MPEANSTPRCPACFGPTHIARSVSRHLLGRRLVYNLVVCLSCGHCIADGPADAALLKTVYSGAFHRSSQQSAIGFGGADDSAARNAPVVRNAEWRTEMLQKMGASGRLLDIGAGCGYFVRAAMRCFRAEGIELSPEAVEAARRLGAPVTCGDFLQLKAEGNEYDVVTFWDVLAGFTTPQQALSHAAGFMKPGALLVATVPDIGSKTAKMLGTYWPLLIPPVNLNYFTSRSISNMLTAAGFTEVVIQHCGKLVSIDFALVKALRLAGWSSLQTLGIPARVSVRLNLGDILTVLAIKDRAGG